MAPTTKFADLKKLHDFYIKFFEEAIFLNVRRTFQLGDQCVLLTYIYLKRMISGEYWLNISIIFI